jgi:multidrug efflux pump subunit AcrA (membrane-fusion protein)
MTMKTSRWISLFAALALLAAGGAWWALHRAPAAAGARAQAGAKVTVWQCSMHPNVIQDHPGICPICHMDLEERQLDADDPRVKKLGLKPILPQEDAAPGPGAAVPGKAAFTLSPERRQLIGVASEAVAVQAMSRILRLPGVAKSGALVLAQLAEQDAGELKPGLKALLLGPQGQAVSATVRSVDASLDSLTRTFGVALQAAKAQPWLQAGVYVEARVELSLGQRLSVPEDAVIDTGLRQVLFVEKEGGRFEPRQVSLGERGNGRVEVLKGVQAGERVVTQASFLIDSESRFQAAIQQF